jgi:uncharacterized protein (TIGR02466 family)
MNIEPLFPIAIGMDKIPKKLTAKQFKFLTTQQMRTNIGNIHSEDSYILDNEELKSLRDELLEIVRKYFKTVYAPSDDVDVCITQSWVNSTEPNKYHHVHSHPNSFISGVFYIHSEGEVDKIKFHKNTYELIRINSTEWNSYNSTSWWYPVNTGDVILFPSSLTHEVPQTASSSNRISLAFNVFLKGRLGAYNDLTELKLI